MFEFTANKFQTRALFVIYADLESVLEPINEHKGYSLLYQRHRYCSAYALLSSPFAGFSDFYFMHTSENAIDRFLEQLI